MESGSKINENQSLGLFINIDYKCKVCVRKVVNGVICSCCDRFVHFSCAGFSSVKELKALESKDAWFCKQCSPNNLQKCDCNENLGTGLIIRVSEYIRSLESKISSLESTFQLCYSNMRDRVEETAQMADEIKVGNRRTKSRLISSLKDIQEEYYLDSLVKFNSFGNKIDHLQQQLVSLSPRLQSSINEPYEKPKSNSKNTTNQSASRSTEDRVTKQDGVKQISQQKTEKKETKVVIVADSHGRGIGQLIRDQLGDEFNVQTFVSSGAGIQTIADKACSEAKNLKSNDWIIVMGGSNDLDDSKGASQPIAHALLKLLPISKKCKLLINTIPRTKSYVDPNRNSKTRDANFLIHQFINNCSSDAKCSKNLFVNFLDKKLSESHLNQSGGHLSKQGKIKLADSIVKLMSPNPVPTIFLAKSDSHKTSVYKKPTVLDIWLQQGRQKENVSQTINDEVLLISDTVIKDLKNKKRTFLDKWLSGSLVK